MTTVGRRGFFGGVAATVTALLGGNAARAKPVAAIKTIGQPWTDQEIDRYHRNSFCESVKAIDWILQPNSTITATFTFSDGSTYELAGFRDANASVTIT